MIIPAQSTTEIDNIIPPEIIGDEFHGLITWLSRTESVRHVLEIGSSAGGGSTTAFVNGLRTNPSKPHLYCMELSRRRFELLAKTYASESFVRCFNVSSVAIEEFPTEEEVVAFYHSTPTSLNEYPLDRVLNWLRQDITYVRGSGVPQNGIEIIRQELGIETFDMVLIDGSEFTGSAELEHVYGAKIILLDDTNAFKCHDARTRLLNDAKYELIADNQKLRNGFSAFRLKGESHSEGDTDALPIHFFTIVLNGEPFIRYHLDMLQTLPFSWQWHIVEGVASLVHDTAWSFERGGRVDDSLHDRGRSNDETSAYLDQIATAEPDRITLYRKPLDQFWDGKREMVSAPLTNIRERCLLWQIDADEIWRAEQICDVRRHFVQNPQISGAFFWCDYFVGPLALIGTRYNYAQNPAKEWLRVWRYHPGDRWAAHEPPTLVRRGRFGTDIDVAGVAPLMHDESEALGAVFQHFAYATEDQVRFKEVYYGYNGAVTGWYQLQKAIVNGTVLLRDYFPWVTDGTVVDAADRLKVSPIARFEPQKGEWHFLKEQEIKPGNFSRRERTPRIVVDGVFFQHNQKSGIARVWRTLLEQWLATGFAKDIILLDRAGTAPRMAGLRYRSIAAWNENSTGADAFLLQKMCDEEKADLFVSSYYTTPISTPSVFVANDMTPERLGIAPGEKTWPEKHYAIEYAAAHICVSNTTRRELLALFPDLASERVFVVPNGVDTSFRPASDGELKAFKSRYALLRPYFLIVGDRIGYKGYKNTAAFCRAFGVWPGHDRFDILCIGGASEIEPRLRALCSGATIRRLELSDEELNAAYSGATALVYPSRYEGFGFPILEAMACGCPVITAGGSAMEEVGGDAAVTFAFEGARDLAEVFEAVTQDTTRQRLIEGGLARARQFEWSVTAAGYTQTFLSLWASLTEGRTAQPSPLWRLFREEQRRNQAAIRQLQSKLRDDKDGHSRGFLEKGIFRGPLFTLRGALLRHLPKSTLPVARKAWRVIMGI